MVIAHMDTLRYDTLRYCSFDPAQVRDNGVQLIDFIHADVHAQSCFLQFAALV